MCADQANTSAFFFTLYGVANGTKLEAYHDFGFNGGYKQTLILYGPVGSCNVLEALLFEFVEVHKKTKKKLVFL